MTAYYQPLKLERGGYHYTCSNSGGTFPLGYCCYAQSQIDDMRKTWEESSENTRWAYNTKSYYERERKIQLQFINKYHVEGHSTADEAIRCYHQYLVDQCKLQYIDDREQKRCQECNEWTQQKISFKGDSMKCLELCEKCSTDEIMLKHLWKPYAHEDEITSGSTI